MSLWIGGFWIASMLYHDQYQDRAGSLGVLFVLGLVGGLLVSFAYYFGRARERNAWIEANDLPSDEVEREEAR